MGPTIYIYIYPNTSHKKQLKFLFSREVQATTISEQSSPFLPCFPLSAHWVQKTARDGCSRSCNLPSYSRPLVLCRKRTILKCYFFHNHFFLHCHVWGLTTILTDVDQNILVLFVLWIGWSQHIHQSHSSLCLLFFFFTYFIWITRTRYSLWWVGFRISRHRL